MFMIEVGVTKWEIERLEAEIAQLQQAGLVGGEGKKQLLANLATVGSLALTGLGSALISVGKRLSGQRTSGRTAVV